MLVVITSPIKSKHIRTSLCDQSKFFGGAFAMASLLGQTYGGGVVPQKLSPVAACGASLKRFGPRGESLLSTQKRSASAGMRGRGPGGAERTSTQKAPGWGDRRLPQSRSGSYAPKLQSNGKQVASSSKFIRGGGFKLVLGKACKSVKRRRDLRRAQRKSAASGAAEVGSQWRHHQAGDSESQEVFSLWRGQEASGEACHVWRDNEKPGEAC